MAKTTTLTSEGPQATVHEPTARLEPVDAVAAALAERLRRARPTLFRPGGDHAPPQATCDLTFLLYTPTLCSVADLQAALGPARARREIVLAAAIPAPLGLVQDAGYGQELRAALKGADMRLGFPGASPNGGLTAVAAALEDLAVGVLTQTLVCLDLADVLTVLTEGRDAYAVTGRGANVGEALERAWLQLPLDAASTCRGALFVISGPTVGIEDFESAGQSLAAWGNPITLGGTLYFAERDGDDVRVSLYVAAD